MPWYDEEAKFYGPRATEKQALSQGDIVLAPTAVIMTGDGPSGVIGPADIGESRRVQVWVASNDELPAAPTFSAEVRWGLAIVVPHSCAMEKEWNERVYDLRQSGSPQQEAEEIASTDESLDQFINLAPIMSYDNALASCQSRIREGSYLSSFPICANQLIPEGYVDFNRLSTVHYKTIPISRRIASLSQLALAHFWHALVMHFAFRALDKFDELNKAVGHRLMSVVAATKTKNRLIVNFLLDDGSTITLEGDPRPVPAQKVPERPVRK